MRTLKDAIRPILTLLLSLLVVPCSLLTAQSGPFLVSTPESSKDLHVSIREDSAGTRQLQVHVAAGGNLNGQKPDILSGRDVSARAFDADGKEIGLTEAPGMGNEEGGNLITVCNAGSCNAIKIYHFSVSKAETDRVRKVVVMFRNKRYEVTMENYSPPKR